jgi:uncharacterized protein YjeT (DUF2065 family)
MKEFLTALALVLVVEGVAYALFPAQLKKLMASVQDQPENGLRLAGLVAVALGVAFVWIIRHKVQG